MHRHGCSVVCHLMARQESKVTWFQPVVCESQRILGLNTKKNKQKCKLWHKSLSVTLRDVIKNGHDRKLLKKKRRIPYLPGNILFLNIARLKANINLLYDWKSIIWDICSFPFLWAGGLSCSFSPLLPHWCVPSHSFIIMCGVSDLTVMGDVSTPLCLFLSGRPQWHLQ